jgi:predicted ATP-grasp superfamily ATP-dependent carboligase
MSEQNTPQGRVIITSGRSLMALAAAQSLGKRGVEVIGSDCIEPHLLSFSKYVEKNETYRSFNESEEQFIEDLISIIERNRPKDERPYLLMPVFDETHIIARHKEQLPEFIKVATPSAETMDRVYPKKNLSYTAQKLGVQIPETRLVNNREELEDLKEKIEFPVLIKPENASGGRGIKKVTSQQELLEGYEKTREKFGDSQLIQQFVDGEDYCMTTLFQDGELKASMAYKNLRRFPTTSGSGVLRETVDDNFFKPATKQLMEPLNWHGIAQLDFLWDEDPEHPPYLIEVNPRFFGGLFQAMASGIDYPWLNYLLHTTGELPEDLQPQLGTKTKVPFAWLLGIIDENMKISDRFDLLTKAGKAAFGQIKEKGMREAFRNFATEWEKTGKKPEEASLSNALEEARMAQSEVFTSDDPFAGLGFLYALSYLVKYRKLPPEMDF